MDNVLAEARAWVMHHTFLLWRSLAGAQRLLKQHPPTSLLLKSQVHLRIRRTRKSILCHSNMSESANGISIFQFRWPKPSMSFACFRVLYPSPIQMTATLMTLKKLWNEDYMKFNISFGVILKIAMLSSIFVRLAFEVT